MLNTLGICFGVFWLMAWGGVFACCRWAWHTERHPDSKSVAGMAGLGMIVSLAWIGGFVMWRAL